MHTCPFSIPFWIPVGTQSEAIRYVSLRESPPQVECLAQGHLTKRTKEVSLRVI